MTSIHCAEIGNYDINLINGSVSHCCKFDPIFFNAREFKQLGHEYFYSNSQTVKARTDLLKGIKTPRCADCWTTEDKNILSWRQIQNSKENTNRIKINLQLSSLCNQACFYCVPNLSSSIAKFDQWIDFNTGQKRKYQIFDHGSKITIDHIGEFIKNIPDNIRILELGLTGGEPFLLNNFEDDYVNLIKIFLEKHPDNTVFLCPSTNGNAKPEKILKFYENIKKQNIGHRLKIMIGMSIENLEQRAEYVRDGLDWNNFIENFNIHINSCDRITIKMTINVFSIVGITDFIKYFSRYPELRFTYNYTTQPFYRVNILDDRFLPEIKKLEKFIIDSNIQYMFDNQWYKELPEMLVDDRKNAKIFKSAISELDNIKNKNWRAVFPEYIDWFDSI